MPHVAKSLSLPKCLNGTGFQEWNCRVRENVQFRNVDSQFQTLPARNIYTCPFTCKFNNNKTLSLCLIYSVFFCELFISFVHS